MNSWWMVHLVELNALGQVLKVVEIQKNVGLSIRGAAKQTIPLVSRSNRYIFKDLFKKGNGKWYVCRSTRTCRRTCHTNDPLIHTNSIL
jgi:hypothetical protein